MAGTTLPPSVAIAHLEAAAAHFSAALAADLATPVPACPGWDLRARRQGHETWMHAWDAEQAVSGIGSPFPLELSLDGPDVVIRGEEDAVRAVMTAPLTP